MSAKTNQYGQFVRRIKAQVSPERIYTDALRCLAWGTDAGFYRLLPKVVVRASNEAEVVFILRTASEMGLPVTFRAAGTSLSGQAITDSILVVAGKEWEKYHINDSKALTITLQPGIIGARVNEILAPYGRFFSPDPASKKSAMVGGIVINNASGMKCGIHANSDRVLRSIRIVLADGTVLDTADENSRNEFRRTHGALIDEILEIKRIITEDQDLLSLIRHKYSIKNVTGLNLLPFVIFDDPFDIIAHCMVGSEGTLAFMSEVTVNTEDVKPFTSSAMVYFDDMARACHAVVALRKSGSVVSCEMLDRKSLASVHDTTGENLTALLMGAEADNEEDLQKKIAEATSILEEFKPFKPVHFSTDTKEIARWWDLRSGIFPAVGGTRPIGTTVIIEDIAFHIDDLPKATVELSALLEECGYNDACIYGHALEGNYHFIIAQSFDTQAEIDRYRNLMEKIEQLVVGRFNGSLKAEHGTGRNMAPFVEDEWGAKATGLMRRIKQAFDPNNILNRGVIFNEDPDCYVHNLKPLPKTDPHIDRCIECGFCEVNCVSCGLTLSARQRIVAQREITRLRGDESQAERLRELEKSFVYFGEETCAGDGLCSTSCPMGINTADLIHDIRERNMGPTGRKIGLWSARHLSGVSKGVRALLSGADLAHAVLGNKGVAAVGKGLHKLGIPLWTPSLPVAFNGSKLTRQTFEPSERKVVYFPSCINRAMGRSEDQPQDRPLPEVFVELCRRAGYEVVFPAGMDNLCCGMIWESKGMPDIADEKTRQLEAALAVASDAGRFPVVCDQSPCLHRMRDHIHSMKLYEPAEFISDFLAPHLTFRPVDTPVAVHVTCSSRRMGLAEKMTELVRRCSTRVLVPQEVGCCGFAGDKGFTHPELNNWGLRKLKHQIEEFGAVAGYSNSRTCEIGLSTNSGIPYKSIVYLVEEVTRP